MKDERYFKKERNFKKHLKWLIPTITTIGILIILYFLQINLSIDTIVFIRIYARYFAMGLSVIGVMCIMYAATGVISQKKTIRYLITTIMVAACLFCYLGSRKPNIAPKQLVEDQIYIRPKSALDTN